MDSKVNLSQLTDLFSKDSSLGKGASSTFVKAFFDTIVEEVSAGGQVRIKGLGTFKQITISDRESVNVNTGERIVIPGHTKVSFTPDSELKELINKPFANFETVVLDAPESNAAIQSVPQVDEEPEPELRQLEPAMKQEESDEHLQSPADANDTVSDTVSVTIPVAEAVENTQNVSDIVPVIERKQSETSDSGNDYHKKKNRRSVGKIVSTVLGIILVLLVITYCIWPLNLLHLMRVEMESLEKSENNTEKLVVMPENNENDDINVIAEGSVVESFNSEIEETNEVQAVIATEPEKTADAAKVSTQSKDMKVSQSANVEDKPVTASLEQSGSFKLTSADEAKSLADITVSDTISYRMTGTLAVHTLSSGETLTKVALQYYGTKKLWPYIAAYNHISDVNKVYGGMKIKVPVLQNK